MPALSPDFSGENATGCRLSAVFCRYRLSSLRLPVRRWLSKSGLGPGSLTVYTCDRQNLLKLEDLAVSRKDSLPMFRLGIIIVLASCAGCVGPHEIRFLTWWQRPASVEARSYDAHDPFGDKTAGPDTYSRPRAFIDPRSDTRKNVDLFFLQAMHPTAGRPELAGVPVVRGPAVPGRGGVPIATGPAPANSPVAAYPYPTTSGMAQAPLYTVSPWAQMPATVPY